MIFYDTCALLDKQSEIFESDFCISVITLQELENIKSSKKYDEDIKYKARKLLHLLSENSNYNIVYYNNTWDNYFIDYPILSQDVYSINDSKIIISALVLLKENPDLLFISSDLSCCSLASACGLKTMYLQINEADYTGFKTLILNNDDIANFYLDNSEITNDLLVNQYLLLYDETGTCIDKYKKIEDGTLKQVQYTAFESKLFGKIKPKDEFQLCAMDSLRNNKLTVLCGSAGTGKTLLALSYLFEQLERGKISKIVIFCNTVATAGAAKLGYYPGSRTEKLMDSQIGNLLSSKFGDSMMVEKLIEDGHLVLLPISDIRGYDTTDMNAGIYITEAQNLNIDLMKLAIQRIGEDCFCILDGDYKTQVDSPLYGGASNGLRRVIKVFPGTDIYGQINLQNIYRSRIAAIAEQL